MNMHADEMGIIYRKEGKNRLLHRPLSAPIQVFNVATLRFTNVAARYTVHGDTKALS